MGGVGDMSNEELFKQALNEGLNRCIEKEVGSEPYEPSERMKRFGEALKKYDIDPTGAILLPGFPERCEGNGKHPKYECCCDECDYLALCVGKGSDEEKEEN